MRPVASGFCKYESLTDGTLSLADVLTMNQFLDNRAHNEALLAKLKEKG